MVIDESVPWVMSNGCDVLMLDLFDRALNDISKRILS